MWVCGSDQKRDADHEKGLVESVKAVHAVHLKSFSKHKPKPASAMNQSCKRIESTKCGRCGRQHPHKMCPAWGKTCLKCSRKHHFAEICRSKSVKDLVQGSERDIF